MMMRTPPSKCPYCDFIADAVSPAYDNDDTPPTPESAITLCLHCSGILFFNPDLTVREPVDWELKMLKSDRQLWRAIQLAQSSIRANTKRRRSLH